MIIKTANCQRGWAVVIGKINTTHIFNLIVGSAENLRNDIIENIDYYSNYANKKERDIEKLNEKENVGGCVLVAGWIDDLGCKELKNFVIGPVKWNIIKKHCKKFTVIQSDNDPWVKNVS